MKMRTLNNKVIILSIIMLVSIAVYQFIFINVRYFDFIMSIRLPKLAAIIIAGVAIATSSLIFQTLINNYIVTPCLLGMNALYLLVHTLCVFIIGIDSFIMTNKSLAFFFDLIIMSTLASIVYGYIFKKTKYNILYVLLIGSVLTTLFSSIQNFLTRAMDPNDYDTLLTTLVASFNNVQNDLLLLSVILMLAIYAIFYKYIKNLDVISLGKNQAINLGVNYDQHLKLLLIFVTLYISIATALVGPISFMGLISTNITRALFKTYKHSYLLIGSALITICILLVSQILIEHVFVYSIPVAVFVTFIGGLYFLYLILKANKNSI